MKNSYFVSFGLPGQNLGVICTDAPNELKALEQITNAGLNPGGEAMITRCDPKEADLIGRNQLISPEHMAALKYKRTSQMTEAEKAWYKAQGTRVCQQCNEAHVIQRN
jgi:hypothetical protein